ncbi:hypothetical protein [Mesorhizobium sp.]|uniref:hypothetical protein n=1 Tax=Mesorhizobium sp. TaxID=1871066 RepID=UPI000FE8A517|nr:hypothetical protein [Mesorhizobium sp.]RWC61068.1 MAG: hypothetical protein EOS29_18955 [Mesorhizobium sp.]RWC63818.1 MAG: hypothetical protein EOS56_03995 [Mesorhizobium sp.]
MGWREDLIARHEEEISKMREGIEWLESDKLQMWETNPDGKRKSLNADMIGHYSRAIESLSQIVRQLQSDIVHAHRAEAHD